MKTIHITAVIILALMGILMFGSVINDSATTDELAHIPAGFSYVTLGDYRLNPEHPPLLKDLAGLSARIFAHPYFSTDTPYWRNEVNGQWAQGAEFLYESGNDADNIIFWSRLPFIILTLIFGWLFFSWTKEKFGGMTALFTLILFAFSPTILTHARFVATDLGAAFGFFIGIASFIKFLENPSWKNTAIAGILFGIAELLKFSLVLLVPIYGIMLVARILADESGQKITRGLQFFFKTIFIGIAGILIIWIMYAPQVWNYPREKQLQDANFILTSYPVKPLARIDLALIKNPITRPLGQYMLGFLMVSQRAGGGNTGFFIGKVSASGSRLYFPLLYLFKEPLAFHILTLIALVFGLSKIRKPKRMNNHWPIPERLRFWIKNNFIEFSSLIFIAVYWASSLASPLNIGVRHVLPTFPFIYLLVSRQIAQWLKGYEFLDPKSWCDVLKNLYRIYAAPIPKYFVTGLLFLWLIADTVGIYPHFMSYYNELAGGAENGYKIAVDSNYDWGQDLKRLHDFVEKNKIEKIAVDYFGGGSPRYYLGDKYEPWWSARGPARGWFAISSTFREQAFGTPAPGFLRKTEDSYEWLKEYEPVARAGYSIFIYKLP